MGDPKSYENTLAYAEKFTRKIQFWFTLDWCLANWVVIFSLIFSAAVPFGLAVLLYVPEGNRNLLNIIFLVLSMLGFILQVISGQLKLKERAQNNGQALRIMEQALPRFKDGILDLEGFYAEYKKACEISANDKNI